MSVLAPLVVAVPLFTAALVAGGDHVAPRPVQNVIATIGAAGTFGLSLALMLTANGHEIVYWFGGWHPRGNVAIGVAFAVGPLEAAMCALTSGLVLAAVVYSVSYMPKAAKLYDALLLLCCAAMCGFVMSGDIFNLFVWLELMGVAAYALTGFEIHRIGPLQGAINFAVVNTVGGFFVLLGIALVYARTGALNLAQIGQGLARHGQTGLVVVAMTLVFVGFFCKAAIVPFHMWLADAYAVAPVPVCLIFAGAMTDIGLVGIARVWFTMFQAPFAGHAQIVGDTLLWLGIVTALLGGVMAYLQRHLKRMLAYSVVAHIGIMLAGIGLLSSKGLAGTALLLLAHGLATGGLFLACGLLLAWLESSDELELFGRASSRRWLGVIWFAGALALIGPPYLGVYVGHALIDDASSALGRHWIPPLLWLAGALSGAALLRAGARIFFGAGSRTDALLAPRLDDAPPARDVWVGMLGSLAGLLVALGLAVSLVPGLSQRAERGAEAFRDRSRYAERVLHARPLLPATRPPFALEPASTQSLVYGAGATLFAGAAAAAGLWRRRLPRRWNRTGARLAGPPIAVLRGLHSGVIGDYVMWISVGTAIVGGVWAVTLR